MCVLQYHGKRGKANTNYRNVLRTIENLSIVGDMNTQDIKRYRPAQAAEMLGIHPQTLRTWEEQGTIPPAARTAGGHRRYSDNDLQRIRQHTQHNMKVWA